MLAICTGSTKLESFSDKPKIFYLYFLPELRSFARLVLAIVTRLCFQYLAIFSKENLPKSIQIVPKLVNNFAKTK